MSKLPTKEEKRQALVQSLHVINGGEDPFKTLSIVEENDFFLIVETYPNGDTGSCFGGKHKFRPEVKPPEKGRVVIGHSKHLYWSLGNSVKDGIGVDCLEVVSDYPCDNSVVMKKELCQWRDFLDPTHHSDGWKEEWNVDLKGGDND